MILRSLLFLALLSGSLLSQVNRDDLTPPKINYTLEVLKDLKTLRVDIDIRHAPRPRLRLAMPNWAPGTYGIGRYGEAVKDLAAQDVSSGAKVGSLRLDHQTWSLETPQSRHLHVSYTVTRAGRGFFRRRGRPQQQGPTTGFSVRGPGTYLYVVDHKQQPITVTYKLPQGWKLTNGLRQVGDSMHRVARDYDTFIDAPTLLGHFQTVDFEINGTPFSCAFFSNDQKYDFDMQGFADVCQKIARSEGKIFGSFPFPNYVFLFTLPGGGGLEHLNSTSIGLNPGRMKQDVRSGGSVTAHEFFHLWNVKRIRPFVLGPFEYQHEDYTGNLWFSEGCTSYYGDLTLARTGIRTRDAWLGGIERIIRTENNKPARKRHSVYWASRNVWHRTPNEAPRVDYYGKGEMLGLLLDISIRNATDNKKSFDDVMRFMNRWFAERGLGFQEGDIERACTAVSNHDFREFFARHVQGTVDPPLAEILDHAGIVYTEDLQVQADLPTSIQRSRFAGLHVVGPRGQKLAEGLRLGDRILAVDGKTGRDWASARQAHKIGDQVDVRLSRAGDEQTVSLTLVKRVTLVPHLSWNKNPTPRQKRIREGLLSDG